jgi:hypothetical protein
MLFIFLLSLCVCVGTSSAITGEELTSVEKGVFIKENTLVHITDAIHSLWVRIVPDKDSALYINSRKVLNDMGKEYASLEYLGYLTEIECMNNRHREITVMFYQKDRNILGSLQKEAAPWQDIRNSSLMQGVYETICSDFVSTEHFEERAC